MSEARFATPRNFDRRSLGHEVADVMRQLGMEPQPWQQQVLDVIYELNDDGSLYYRENRVTVPRQAGKSTLILAKQLHRVLNSERLGWGKRPLCAYTAQTAAAAREKLVREWYPMIAHSEIDQRLERFYKGNGKESLDFDTGGRVMTVAPTETGAHGLVLDSIDLDECFSYVDARAEQAARPALITRKSAQIGITSTAGTAESKYLWDKVEDGRARVTQGIKGPVAYFEWSAEPTADPSDPATWRAAHPALGNTITEAALQIEHDTLPIDEFRRAYLNQWTASQSRIIPAAAWARCLDPKSEFLRTLYIAVDASPGIDGGRTACIAAAGLREDGYIHVEVVEHAPGLSWVAERVDALSRKWKPSVVYCDATGPISSILPDLKNGYTDLEVVDSGTMAGACTRFHQAVLEGTLRHRGQEALDKAVEGAAKRTLVDSWAFSRRTSTTDICPLVAVTLAHYAAAVDGHRTNLDMPLIYFGSN